MKKFVLFAIFLASSAMAKSQDLMFNISQSGSAYRDTKTGDYFEVEVEDTKATIVLKNNQVTVKGNNLTNYMLANNVSETKVNDHVIVRRWKSTDENKLPLVFTYRVNTRSKEAVVELTYKEVKNFYFGTYSIVELVGKN